MRNGCRYKVSVVSLVSKARRMAQSRYPELELNLVESTVNWKVSRTIWLDKGWSYLEHYYLQMERRIFLWSLFFQSFPSYAMS